ncbi:MAG: hypothetical protein HUJ54_02455 [Erysipelotrichaceae bacterium]|nr:hypothetical protein [Erysipelotrichaceae bacterium]
MKQLTCEMCGSTDLVKQDGVFVCQSCGCKYSLDEAKKMMVEGTVDVQGTVKVDNSASIKNYYTIAEHAYESGNNKETENYCNKIIEIDPTDYKAWFLKGKAAGWQSTPANLRIEESVNCFKNAIDNAPEDEKDKIKKECANEFKNLSAALISHACNRFVKSPSEQTAQEIVADLKITNRYSFILLLKCGSDPEEFKKTIAKVVYKSAVQAWNETIYPYYRKRGVSKDFLVNGGCVVLLIGSAINEYNDDQDVIQWYKEGISISTCFLNVALKVYPNYTPPAREQLMSWCQKIKELDPNYEIPELSQPNTQSEQTGGCYVATAVYGSYDCPEVWTLRRYRDYILAETWYGRAFIRTYYAISPTLVKWFGHTNWFKRMWRGKLDRMVDHLRAEGIKDTPYVDRNW